MSSSCRISRFPDNMMLICVRFGPIDIESKKRTMKPRQKQVIAEETRPEEIASQHAATQKASEEDFVRNANLVCHLSWTETAGLISRSQKS